VQGFLAGEQDEPKIKKPALTVVRMGATNAPDQTSDRPLSAQVGAVAIDALPLIRKARRFTLAGFLALQRAGTFAKLAI
jgi:hypothetical protein